MGCWKTADVSKRRVSEVSLRAREQTEEVRGKLPVPVLAQGCVISLITQNMIGTSWRWACMFVFVQINGYQCKSMGISAGGKSRIDHGLVGPVCIINLEWGLSVSQVSPGHVWRLRNKWWFWTNHGWVDPQLGMTVAWPEFWEPLQ